ncbi:hypothetical protein RD792_006093 [Penstemon davidsonii]|uniref:Uncharacterized protein n=1 Tax=Penstemon davidsonii TaxID=160366 RepID=A0ABR0DDJ1_9LAMI|nr:hypothetical protein RD792_006093 [Penstemon davidsonii]
MGGNPLRSLSSHAINAVKPDRPFTKPKDHWNRSTWPSFVSATVTAFTTFSLSALLPSYSAPTPKPPFPPPSPKPHLTIPTSKLTAAALAAATILTSTPSVAADSYKLYYGTAASAASYGGNSDKKASAEYTYDVPDGWKEKLVSKIQKGTNGTDSEFYNPKKKSEKEYLTCLSGFRNLAPKDVVLNNLALSDVDLQDLIAGVRTLAWKKGKMKRGRFIMCMRLMGLVDIA